jgi:hypothetical protein
VDPDLATIFLFSCQEFFGDFFAYVAHLFSVEPKEMHRGAMVGSQRANN